MTPEQLKNVEKVGYEFAEILSFLQENKFELSEFDKGRLFEILRNSRPSQQCSFV